MQTTTPQNYKACSNGSKGWTDETERLVCYLIKLTSIIFSHQFSLFEISFEQEKKEKPELSNKCYWDESTIDAQWVERQRLERSYSFRK